MKKKNQLFCTIWWLLGGNVTEVTHLKWNVSGRLKPVGCCFSSIYPHVWKKILAHEEGVPPWQAHGSRATPSRWTKKRCTQRIPRWIHPELLMSLHEMLQFLPEPWRHRQQLSMPHYVSLFHFPVLHHRVKCVCARVCEGDYGVMTSEFRVSGLNPSESGPSQTHTSRLPSPKPTVRGDVGSTSTFAHTHTHVITINGELSQRASVLGGDPRQLMFGEPCASNDHI